MRRASAGALGAVSFVALLLATGTAAARIAADDEPAALPDESGGGDGAADPGGATGPEEPSYLYFPPIPFYQETTSSTGLRLFFPLYFEQWDDEVQEHSLGVLPFYWRWRGPDELHETDVVLGLYWRYRRPDRFTDVAGPLYVSRTADGYDVGLPPLFMVGADAESSYQILALYFWRFAWETGVFALAPPFYYYQEGRKLRYGLPPLLFGGQDGPEGYSIFFPLFWHFFDESTDSSTTVIPPLLVDLAAQSG